MSLKKIRKFIKGPLAGTRLEIMNSKPATHLPNGSPIVEYDYDNAELTPTQVCHRLGKLNVHEPQVFDILNEDEKRVHRYEGPTIAQEWKLLHQGKRPFYQDKGPL